MNKKWECIILSCLGLLSFDGLRAAEELRVFTSTEVAHHETPEDCWLIIDGRVYDVTSYLSKHPKKYPLTSECGQDVTEGWKTKGEKNKPHSRKAEIILKKLLVGRVVDP